MNIHLKSSDGVIFDVELAVITKRSELIRGMIESLGEDNLDEPIPIKQLKSDILGMIVEFVTYHKDSPMPNGPKDIEMTEWDQQFLKVDIPTLIELVNAANFLDMKDLLYLACAQMRSIVKSPPGNLQKSFNF